MGYPVHGGVYLYMNSEGWKDALKLWAVKDFGKEGRQIQVKGIIKTPDRMSRIDFLSLASAVQRASKVITGVPAASALDS